MKKKLYFAKVALTIFAFSTFTAAEAVAPSSVVKERDVRAAMYFLAGDAMQGRGSGTKFERIAAEYVGSQFMQFGLEPAGEAGFDGKPTFVQTVQAPSRETLTALAIDGTSIKLGEDLIAFAIAGNKLPAPCSTRNQATLQRKEPSLS